MSFLCDFCYGGGCELCESDATPSTKPTLFTPQLDNIPLIALEPNISHLELPCQWCEEEGCSECESEHVQQPTLPTSICCDWCDNVGCDECQPTIPLNYILPSSPNTATFSQNHLYTPRSHKLPSTQPQFTHNVMNPISITFDDIILYMNHEIRQVCTTFHIPFDQAEIFLRTYEWNFDSLIQSFLLDPQKIDTLRKSFPLFDHFAMSPEDLEVTFQSQSQHSQPLLTLPQSPNPSSTTNTTISLSDSNQFTLSNFKYLPINYITPQTHLSHTSTFSQTQHPSSPICIYQDDDDTNCHFLSQYSQHHPQYLTLNNNHNPYVTNFNSDSFVNFPLRHQFTPGNLNTINATDQSLLSEILHTCPVCYTDDLPREDVCKFFCSHIICNDCFLMYLKEHIDSMGINSIHLTCPEIITNDENGLYTNQHAQRCSQIIPYSFILSQLVFLDEKLAHDSIFHPNQEGEFQSPLQAQTSLQSITLGPKNHLTLLSQKHIHFNQNLSITAIFSNLLTTPSTNHQPHEHISFDSSQVLFESSQIIDLSAPTHKLYNKQLYAPRFRKWIALHYISKHPHRFRLCPSHYSNIPCHYITYIPPLCLESMSTNHFNNSTVNVIPQLRSTLTHSTNYTHLCLCGYIQCVNPQCTIFHAHFPVPCTVAEIFRMKSTEDRLTQQLIESTTKACPKCRNPITKGMNCNHITCTCGHQWCFLCKGDWSLHIGFYHCTRFSNETDSPASPSSTSPGSNVNTSLVMQEYLSTIQNTNDLQWMLLYKSLAQPYRNMMAAILEIFSATIKTRTITGSTLHETIALVPSFLLGLQQLYYGSSIAYWSFIVFLFLPKSQTKHTKIILFRRAQTWLIQSVSKFWNLCQFHLNDKFVQLVQNSTIFEHFNNQREFLISRIQKFTRSFDLLDITSLLIEYLEHKSHHLQNSFNSPKSAQNLSQPLSQQHTTSEEDKYDDDFVIHLHTIQFRMDKTDAKNNKKTALSAAYLMPWVCSLCFCLHVPHPSTIPFAEDDYEEEEANLQQYQDITTQSIDRIYPSFEKYSFYCDPKNIGKLNPENHMEQPSDKSVTTFAKYWVGLRDALKQRLVIVPDATQKFFGCITIPHTKQVICANCTACRLHAEVDCRLCISLPSQWTGSPS